MTYLPMLQILKSAGIGKRARSRVVQQCSHFARLALDDVRVTDDGRFLFHASAAMEWIAGDGAAIVDPAGQWAE